MHSDGDEQQRVVLFVLVPILAVVISGVVGVGVLKARGGPSDLYGAVSMPAVVANGSVTAGTATQPDADDASVVVQAGVVKFYFATGSAELASGAGAALVDVVLAAQNGQFVMLSGFHDETGDANFNADLAKRRAMAVRAALLMAGAPEDRLVMRAPEVLTGSGSNANARRVEVVVRGGIAAQ